MVEPSGTFCERSGDGGDYGTILPILTDAANSPFDAVVTIPAGTVVAGSFSVPSGTLVFEAAS